MDKLVKILMERDNMTKEGAISLIDEARDAFHNYIDDGDYMSAEEVCYEFFGLEPDYLDFLM